MVCSLCWSDWKSLIITNFYQPKTLFKIAHTYYVLCLGNCVVYCVDHWREGVVFQGQSRVLCERKHLQRATPTLLHQEPTFQWVVTNKYILRLKKETLRISYFISYLNYHSFDSTECFQTCSTTICLLLFAI